MIVGRWCVQLCTGVYHYAFIFYFFNHFFKLFLYIPFFVGLGHDLRNGFKYMRF